MPKSKPSNKNQKRKGAKRIKKVSINIENRITAPRYTDKYKITDWDTDKGRTPKGTIKTPKGTPKELTVDRKRYGLIGHFKNDSEAKEKSFWFLGANDSHPPFYVENKESGGYSLYVMKSKIKDVEILQKRNKGKRVTANEIFREHRGKFRFFGGISTKLVKTVDNKKDVLGFRKDFKNKYKKGIVRSVRSKAKKGAYDIYISKDGWGAPVKDKD